MLENRSNVVVHQTNVAIDYECTVLYTANGNKLYFFFASFASLAVQNFTAKTQGAQRGQKKHFQTISNIKTTSLCRATVYLFFQTGQEQNRGDCKVQNGALF